MFYRSKDYSTLQKELKELMNVVEDENARFLMAQLKERNEEVLVHFHDVSWVAEHIREDIQATIDWLNEKKEFESDDYVGFRTFLSTIKASIESYKKLNAVHQQLMQFSEIEKSIEKVELVWKEMKAKNKRFFKDYTELIWPSLAKGIENMDKVKLNEKQEAAYGPIRKEAKELLDLFRSSRSDYNSSAQLPQAVEKFKNNVQNALKKKQKKQLQIGGSVAAVSVAAAAVALALTRAQFKEEPIEA